MKKVISFIRDGKAEEWMGRIAMFLVLVPIIANIFTRALLSKYFISLEAIALTAYVWLGYAGFGYLYKTDAHVDVALLRKLMPPLGKTLMDWFRDIYIFVLSAVLVYWGFRLTRNNIPCMYAGSTISLWYASASIVVGYGSGFIRSGWSLGCRIVNLFKKNKEVA